MAESKAGRPVPDGWESRRWWPSRIPARWSRTRVPVGVLRPDPGAAEQVTIEGAAHFLQEDRDERIAEAILDRERSAG